MAQREREEEAAREAHRAAMRAEMAESNRLQLQLKVGGRVGAAGYDAHEGSVWLIRPAMSLSMVTGERARRQLCAELISARTSSHAVQHGKQVSSISTSAR